LYLVETVEPKKFPAILIDGNKKKLYNGD
jgi:hypothetical protein